VEFLEMMSEDAVKHIPDNSLDFVYIDANHKYDFVMLDILLWSRKVRKGGVVSGHDYFNNPKYNMGVKPAVDDYVRQHNKTLYLTDKVRDPEGRQRVQSWWFVK
jgi:predicted O-methyltransferase YrrM